LPGFSRKRLRVTNQIAMDVGRKFNRELHRFVDGSGPELQLHIGLPYPL
jgi:hypothetical protein